MIKLLLSRQNFDAFSNIKFHENPLIGNRAFHGDRRTDMTKLIVAFRNFLNATKKDGSHVLTQISEEILCLLDRASPL